MPLNKLFERRVFRQPHSAHTTKDLLRDRQQMVRCTNCLLLLNIRVKLVTEHGLQCLSRRRGSELAKQLSLLDIGVGLAKVQTVGGTVESVFRGV